ncbi:DNA cytosine methyltransferase [Thermodesulfobacteriota bacterium]
MKVISLFCGCGGFDLGIMGAFSYLGKHYKKTGHKIIFANDFDKNACSTNEANLGSHVLCEDIRKVEEFPAADMVIGGYPCQGFSIIGTRLVADKRNFLYLEYAKCLEKVNPKIFIAENVKGLLSLAGGEVINAMVKEFELKGYKVVHQLLNAKNFGIPQDRERVFIVGVRKGLDFRFRFPKKTHGSDSEIKQLPLFQRENSLKPYVTLKNAIGNLSEPKEEELYTAKFSPIYMSRNRRRSWNEQSFTIQAGSMHVPLHPSSPPMKQIGIDEWEFGEGISRRLTPKECMMIQSFPDDFKLYGEGFATQYRQVGNAVPPVLAWHLSKNIPEKV